MKRVVALAILLASPLRAEPAATSLALRDVEPAYVHGGRMLRSRTRRQAGLFVAQHRFRGLGVGSNTRAGFELDGAFRRLVVRVGVLDGSRTPVRFLVFGDGRRLFATPPLFPAAAPLRIEVDVERVLLLELVTQGEGRSEAAWLEGRLEAAAGRDLARFRAVAAPFDRQAYPSRFRRRVNRAIDAAVKRLFADQRPDGTWTGHRRPHGVTALALLALFKAGADPDHPRLLLAYERLRQQGFDHVYSVACLLMAIEARHFPRGADPETARAKMPKRDREWMERAATWLAAQQGAGFPDNRRAFHPVWRYPSGGYDLSNTQYALFGLAAAARCGIARRKVWFPALRYILAAQEKKGPKLLVSRYFRDGRYLRRRTEKAEARGFGYVLSRTPTGSMTSAGLCSLVLCQEALRRNQVFQQSFRRRTRTAIRDALAWLEEYYDLAENPLQPGSWWTYYLFNVERAGVLLDQRYLGTRDWYAEGAELLLARQKEGGFGSTVDTCFALLFLKRATVPVLTNPLK